MFSLNFHFKSQRKRHNGYSTRCCAGRFTISVDFDQQPLIQYESGGSSVVLHPEQK